MANVQKTGLTTKEPTRANEEITLMANGSDLKTLFSVAFMDDASTTPHDVEKKPSDDLQTVTPVLSEDQSEGNSTLDMTDVPQTDEFQIPPHPLKAGGPIAGMLITGNVIVLITGIPGNLFAVAVLVRKELRKSPGSIFLIAMTIADAAAILFNPMLTDIALQFLSLDPNILDIGCKMWLSSFSMFSEFSKCSLTAFTFERFLSICFPLRSRRVISQKVGIVYLVMCILILLSALVHDVLVFGARKTEVGVMCHLAGKQSMLTIVRENLSLYFGIGTAITILLLNSTMILMLIRRKRNLRRMSNNTESINTLVSCLIE